MLGFWVGCFGLSVGYMVCCWVWLPAVLFGWLWMLVLGVCLFVAIVWRSELCCACLRVSVYFRFGCECLTVAL